MATCGDHILLWHVAANHTPDVLLQEPEIEAFFSASSAIFGEDLHAYRNHVYRVFNLACALRKTSEVERRKLAWAAYFHDLGIWADHTFDYLEPSAARAEAALREQGLDAWVDEIRNMIAEHHKITKTQGMGPLVEIFRRADWIDVSLGILRFGLPGAYLTELRRAFPNRGFHRRLVSLTLERARRHPTRPLPMFKW